MPQLPQQVEWTPPTKAELTKAISSLKDTASGPSGIPACVWKSLGSEQETFDILLHVMQQCWRTKTTPVTWSRSHMAVIPKKGDISLPKNFRSIMVGDFDGKLYQIILNNRLKVLYENIALASSLPLPHGEEHHLGCPRPLRWTIWRHGGCEVGI